MNYLVETKEYQLPKAVYGNTRDIFTAIFEQLTKTTVRDKVPSLVLMGPIIYREFLEYLDTVPASFEDGFDNLKIMDSVEVKSSINVEKRSFKIY